MEEYTREAHMKYLREFMPDRLREIKMRWGYKTGVIPYVACGIANHNTAFIMTSEERLGTVIKCCICLGNIDNLIEQQKCYNKIFIDKIPNNMYNKSAYHSGGFSGGQYVGHPYTSMNHEHADVLAKRLHKIEYSVQYEKLLKYRSRSSPTFNKYRRRSTNFNSKHIDPSIYKSYSPPDDSFDDQSADDNLYSEPSNSNKSSRDTDNYSHSSDEHTKYFDKSYSPPDDSFDDQSADDNLYSEPSNFNKSTGGTNACPYSSDDSLSDSFGSSCIERAGYFDKNYKRKLHDEILEA